MKRLLSNSAKIILINFLLIFTTVMQAQTREFVKRTSNFNSIDHGANSVPNIADIDGDGLLDLIVGFSNGYMWHYEQDSENSTTFTATVPARLQTSAGVNIDVGVEAAPFLIDIDNDGKLDLLIGDDGDGINHYEQTAVNAFSFDLITTSFVDIGGGRNHPTVTDLDGDGLLDLLVGTYNGTISHYEQDAADSYTFNLRTKKFSNINLGSASEVNPTFTDFYNDGILDLVIRDRDQRNLIYYIQSSQNSTSFNLVDNTLLSQSIDTYLSPFFTDLDGDNLLDLLIGEYDGNINHWEAKLNITTDDASNISTSSADCGGSTILDGTSTMTARGLCWGTSTSPTTSGSHSNEAIGIGDFSTSITGLSQATTYYVRGYCTNNGTTTYGAEKSFTTDDIPTVTTDDVSNIGNNSADCGGNVTSDNGDAVTARGVCWSTNQNPTTANTKTTDGTGEGTFQSSLTGLLHNTTYYVRAYATNSIGTSYGAQKSFTTDAVPSVTTDAATNIAVTTATSGGNVTSDNDFAVTVRGVCWSTSENPTTANSKTENGAGTGTFTSSITGLTLGTLYYVRAYATNSHGTGYGNQESFTTDDIPSVTTDAATNIAVTTATSGGNVTSDNGDAVTARGVCWSTNPTPTTADSFTDDGTGEGAYQSGITGLQRNTKYYIRSYATNAAGTGYGDEKEFYSLYELLNTLKFSGINEYITNSVALPDNGTIETWVYFDNTSSSMRIFDAGGGSTNWYLNHTSIGYNLIIGNYSIVSSTYS
ncbi:MAG: VCBS repeat-containing protein, partial [Chlorobi bacterium]|nr:VCBS repeat-containing protein [Chlorobiota bacterium]